MKIAQRSKQSFLMVFIMLAVLAAAIFSSLPFLVRSQYLEQLITQTVRNELGYLPAFEHLRVSFFPIPVLHVDNFELKPIGPDDHVPLIRAERADFRPSLLSFLFGKSELAHAALKNADIHYTWRGEDGKLVKTVSFKDVFIDLWNVRSNRPIRFKIRGAFLSDSENVALEGTFRSDFKDFRIKDFILKSQTSIGPVELLRLEAWWGGALPLSFKSGTLSFSCQAVKTSGASEFEVKGSANIQNLVYQLPPKSTTSEPGDYRVEFQARIDLASGSVVLKEATLTAPFGGPFDVEAKVNMFTATVDEIFVKSRALRLEALPQYLLAFETILPVNLGFSGESQLDFFAKGGPELLLTNLRIDLTQTTLSYSKYFSKPSGVPFLVRSDLKLAGARLLRGDFSLEFEEAALKGSLVGLDLVSGESEMTVLTNKFSIDGWERYFPHLQQFELSGGIKILTSVKGNFHRMNEARVMHHVSFEGLEAKASNGAQIRNLNGSIDFGPLDSELKNIQFEIGHSQFLVEGKMFRQPDTRWLVGIQSPDLDVRDFISQLHKASEAIPLTEAKLDFASIEESVKKVISPEESFEQFHAQVASGEKQVVIPTLRFNVSGGTVLGRAVFDYTQAVPRTAIELELDHLNLARMQDPAKKPVMSGNLFAVATLTGEGPLDSEWLDRLKGKGSLAVTNGELHTLDILGGLGEISELAPLGHFKSGITRFSDIRGDFQVEHKKIRTENLVLLSDDFQIEAAGDVNFEGNLNFRLSVYLAPGLSQKISPHLDEHARLGPIPILVVGSISEPSIRKDPMLIRTFLEHLVQEQFSKITSRFVPSSRREAQPLPTEKDQTSSGTRAKSGEPENMEQALLQSGFSLLEQFLSQKKSPS